jgi:hypothetical protein
MSAGTVAFTSRNGGMIVVRHDDGYALVELLGDEGALAVGDAVSGDWDSRGGERVYSRGRRYEAYFQGTWGSPDAPMRMARGG